jgi:exodeoxyribonuclease V beta subunit
LKKGIDGERFSEDEYLQRIESDEAAVKIVTIHSSKGLEYDIVIAPYLDMTTKNYFDTTQFRGHDNYYIAKKDSLDKDDALEAKRQTEKENLRLLYVAITRARYHCYVMKTAAVQPGKNNTTTLTKIKDQIINHGKDSKTIRFLGDENAKDEYKNSGLFELNPPELLLMSRVTRQPQDPLVSFAKIPEIKIPDEKWQKTSYSRLNIKQDPLLKVHEEVGVDKYDEFIFKKLRKGAQTGNFLHDLLERLDFTKKDYWEYAIKSSLNRYGGTGLTSDYLDMMKQMLEQITETILRQESGFNLSLNMVQHAQRLNELEFDLPLSEIDWNLVPQNFEDGRIPIRIRRETPISGGILNGKVDLFFEKEGRFYILDWKSNHLGNRAEDYHENAMAEAMAENNYHLQYYLYSLALLRYLQTRMPGFDYEKQFGGVYYLFIRGMRKGKETGIYFHKPLEKDLILLENALLKPVAVKI